MISRLTSRSRSDSRPRPLQIPGRSIKVRSLIEFYNQKALQQAVITSRPYYDQNKIPSNKVKSLVQSYTSVISSITSQSNPSSRGSGARVHRGAMTSPIALRKQSELPSNKNGLEDTREIANPRPRKKAGTGLRSVKGWKSSRDRKPEKPATKAEADGPVARKSTRRKKKESPKRDSLKNIGSLEEATPQKEIQPLTAPRLKALESEMNRSSSLEMEISTSPGNPISDGGSTQTPRLLGKGYIEKGVAKDEIRTSTERKIEVPKAPSVVSKHSGSWKGAFQSVRDSFRRRSSTAESTISTKASEESVSTYKPKPLESILDNPATDPQDTGYITAPDTFGASKNLISAVQIQVNRPHMLETLASETENENILPSDHEQQRSSLDVDKTSQEVSGPSLSQTVEDLNTISGVGEMATWDNNASARRRLRTFSKQRSERRSVVNTFRPPSPVLRRTTPLKSVSPLRVIKEKEQTTTTTVDASGHRTTFNRPKSKLGPIAHTSMDTVTSFEELSSPNSLDSLSEIQKEGVASKRTPVAIVQSTFESLSSLATPPPAQPLREVRSPTLIREMAFPALRLRDGEQDTDTPVKKSPALKRKVATESISVPKKIIYGDADWRTDRYVGGNNVDETTQRLQELQKDGSTPSSYGGQRLSPISGAQDRDFTTLPRQNYTVPVPEANGSPGAYREMEMEPPFMTYTVNPPLPAGAPSPSPPPYQKIKEHKSQYLNKRTPAIEVGADGQGEQVARGRRRRRVGS